MISLLKCDPKPKDSIFSRWVNRLSGLYYIIPLVKMFWNTHRIFTITIFLLRFLRALIPISVFFVGKLIIDTVIAAQKDTSFLLYLWIFVFVEFCIVFAGEVVTKLSCLVEGLLSDLFSIHSSVKLMEHASTLDLYQFEDSSFYDQLNRAQEQTSNRVGLMGEVLRVFQELFTIVSLGIALWSYNFWFLIALAVAVLPSFFSETHFSGLLYSFLNRWTPERRKLDYIRKLGTSDKTVKETQVFGLSPWLIFRYKSMSERFFKENQRISIKRARNSLYLAIIGNVGYYGALCLILKQAVGGAITLGTLTFLIITFARSRDAIQRFLSAATVVIEQSLYLKDLFSFFELRPNIVSKPDAIKVSETIKTGFVFEDVGFCYPGSSSWAVRNINLTLGPGECVALVGENGSGKTTLIKLLARLYDPTEGRILLDGIDLREYEIASLRSGISVIFQDFVRYSLRLDENIGFGDIDKVKNYLLQIDQDSKNSDRFDSLNKTIVPKEIINAAEASLANSLSSRFQCGYSQMLGRGFDDGVDLSGGEWQKVALARAYMRHSQVIILDEPTAALDARSEFEVFERFSKLVKGRMSMVISHRFSTVRMADRIVVLDKGSIKEEGSHQELITMGGLYAELFNLQAAGYQ
jgi:ATP-binding cassette, subfamily B, bacterial